MMRDQQMAEVVKSEWFGREISVLLTNGKRVSGELTQVSPNFIVLDREGGEVQVMKNAVILIQEK
jgi:sRNA-binding regulator protein Hfq